MRSDVCDSSQYDIISVGTLTHCSSLITALTNLKYENLRVVAVSIARCILKSSEKGGLNGSTEPVSIT